MEKQKRARVLDPIERVSEIIFGRSPSMMKRIAPVVAMVGVILVGCSQESAKTQRPAPEVTIVTVKPQTVPYAPTFVAQTESSRQVDIVARVSRSIPSPSKRSWRPPGASSPRSARV
jgi:hypothetical protein